MFNSHYGDRLRYLDGYFLMQTRGGVQANRRSRCVTTRCRGEVMEIKRNLSEVF